MEIKVIREKQRDFYRTGNTIPLERRKRSLLSIQRGIQRMEGDILEALSSDLGKSGLEGYMTEVGMVLDEISYMLRHLKRFSKVKAVRTPLAQFWAKSYIKPTPYGNVLIISPWNYPFLLTMTPLIDALSAGNTAVIKPSNYSPATSKIISHLIKETSIPELVTVVEGGRETNSQLLEEPFDYIFFTGSKEVGRLVMERASKHLTPVTLELGGKSPVIVDETADLKLAAKRIVFGKFLNCGQTCVAPDYILAHKKIYKELLVCLKDEIISQYGSSPLENENYGKIINEKHFERLQGLLQNEKVIAGGQTDADRRIAPTIIVEVTLESPIMQEEIFGPILPVLEFETLDEAIEMIDQNPTPLALYLFTYNKNAKKRVTTEVSFGGGCINDTVIHLATSHMGFGGVGESGMGNYHGRAGFDTFTHYKSIVDKKTIIDLPFRYQPYTERKEKMIRQFLK